MSEDKDKRVFVPLTKCLVILYPEEIKRLLFNDLELFEKAIRRGKYELRCQAVEKRKDTRYDDIKKGAEHGKKA